MVTRWTTAHTVAARMSTASKDFGIEREDSQMSSPILLCLFRMTGFVRRCSLPTPYQEEDQGKYCKYTNDHWNSDGSFETWRARHTMTAS